MSYLILTDSLSSLLELRSFYPTHPLIQEILTRLTYLDGAGKNVQSVVYRVMLALLAMNSPMQQPDVLLQHCVHGVSYCLLGSFTRPAKSSYCLCGSALGNHSKEVGLEG